MAWEMLSFSFAMSGTWASTERARKIRATKSRERAWLCFTLILAALSVFNFSLCSLRQLFAFRMPEMGIMMKISAPLASIALFFVLSMASTATSTAASPDHASSDYVSGIVTHVVDGDTFNVQGFGQVSLALVNSPEMGTIEGVHAREYTMERLLDAVVFLDKDDLSGNYADGGIPCMVYLSGQDGKPNLEKSFNMMIVDADYAVIKNDTPSEFDPAQW